MITKTCFVTNFCSKPGGQVILIVRCYVNVVVVKSPEALYYCIGCFTDFDKYANQEYAN